MLLFTILVVVAIVAVSFAFLYRYNIDKLVNEYVSTITTCENIVDEGTCYDYDFCAGVYVPKCEDCQDYEFTKCVRVPDVVAQKSAQERKLCEEKNGVWTRNRMGEGCILN
jgi:hypothetical protein